MKSCEGVAPSPPPLPPGLTAPMEKPADCLTAFVGNLSYDVDDDAMREFAEDCGEIKDLRFGS